MRLTTSVSALGLVLAMSVPATQGRAQAQAAPSGPPTVSTTGHAETTVTPDRATILVAVQTEAPTAAAAAADNAKRTRAVLDTLHALGLSKEQTGTLGYTVSPKYTYDKGNAHVTGYEAQNTVKVELKVVADVGRVIDASLASGANNISSLQFTASNVDSARREALSRATLQARGDAEAMAKALGASLGAPVELTTETQGGVRLGPQPMMRMALAAPAQEPTPVDAGPLTVSAAVHGRWQLVAPH
jgi:uncharacterized protein